MKVYWKREKLEAEYQQKCGDFIRQLEIERKMKWRTFERRKEVGLKRFKSEKEMRNEFAKNVEKEQKRQRSQRLSKRKASQGLLRIAQDPRRFFKDVIGEKKSLFAQNLGSVKKYLKQEIQRKADALQRETKLLEKDGNKREGKIMRTSQENEMRRWKLTKARFTCRESCKKKWTRLSTKKSSFRF